MKPILLAMAAGWLLAALPTMSAENANLLTNGGFEAGTAGAGSRGAYPPGWRRGIGTGEVLETVAEARPGSTGKQAVRLDLSAERPSGGMFTELAPVDPSRAVIASGWLKPLDAERGLKGVYFGLAWYDADRKPIVLVPKTSVNYVYLHDREERDGWFRLHTVILPWEAKADSRYAVPPNAAFCELRVFTLKYPAPVLVDDVEAYQLSADEAKKLLPKPAPAAAATLAALVPTQPVPIPEGTRWVVAWTGDKAAGQAAVILRDYLAKVLETEVVATPWQPTDAPNVILVTHAQAAPPEAAARLAGKFHDSFLIRSPATYGGRQVCLMVAGDEYACDYPVYWFLSHQLNVHWVGPGELGEVWKAQPEWRMPASLDVLEVPDFAMRLWSGKSFSSREWLARSSRMGFHHALGHVFDPKVHADTPEVYPLVGGKRYMPDPNKQMTGGWQPCTSNPKSIEIATNYVLEQFRRNPRQISVSLSVNDGAGNVCECDSCRALDPPGSHAAGQRPDLSNRFFTFYNQVTENVLKELPQAYIAVLGYGPCKNPPSFPVNSHIQVFEVQPNAAKLRQWGEAGAGPNIYLWLWDGGFLTVRPDLGTIAELVRACHQYHGLGCYSEIVPHWVVSAPKFYVLARLLWDADTDESKALDEYLGYAYGPAAPALRGVFDRWYEIYRRRPADELYQTSWGWRDASQLEYVTRDDLTAMRELMSRAQAAPVSDKERQRLALLAAWQELMDVNADQYLAAKSLADPAWLAAQKPEAVVAEVARTAGFTERFNTLWREKVLADKTGWLLDGNYTKDPNALWNRFFGSLRTSVASMHETAMDGALASVSARLAAGMDKVASIAFWEGQIKAHPEVAPYAVPIVNQLKGVTPQEVVTNGSFEQGTPGKSRPALPGWEFYEDYGMVKGVSARYAWEPGSGFDGGRAIAFGEGRYPEMKGIVQLVKDGRYRLSLRYRTSPGQERQPSFWIFSYDGPLATAKDIDRDKIHSFLTIKLDPTGGEWKQVTRTFTSGHDGTHVLMLVSYYLTKDQWTWWDDLRIERLY